MARWSLQTAHYLPVPGTIWEHRETDTRTQKSVRKDYTVPLYLDPRDPADHNYKDDGLIIVTNVENHRAHPRDIYFLGPPTPDMTPLDEEAEQISESFAASWIHPIDNLEGGHSQSMFLDLERQLSEAIANAGRKAAQPPPAVSEGMVSKAEFDELKSQIAQLMQMNQVLMDERAQLATAADTGDDDAADADAIIEDATPEEASPPPKPEPVVAKPSVQPIHPSVAAQMAGGGAPRRV